MVAATAAALTSMSAAAAPMGDAEHGLRSAQSSWSLSAERLKLAGGERVGLVGAGLRVAVGDQWLIGPSVYGAATGRRGGLFVIGGEGLWRTPGPWGSRVEAGLFIGGGGGAAAPVGGGLMLRPQLSWLWPVGPAWVGVAASRVRFPSGQIDSRQLGVVLQLDDTLHYLPAGRAAGAAARPRSGLGVDRLWLTVGRYRSAGAGAANYSYGGLRAEREWQPGWWLGLEGAGAATGAADGYAEVLASVAAEWPVLGRGAPWGGAGGPLSVGLRGAAGLAGGGAVDTGGGPLLKLAGTLSWAPSDDLLIGLEAGRTVAPDGRFRARHLQASVALVLDRPRGAAGSDAHPAAPGRDDQEWSAVVSHLPRVRFRDGSDDGMQQLGMRVRRPLAPALDERLQLSGTVQFAYGGRAGAYGAGLVGLAYASPIRQPGLSWGAELLAGAAGGGGVQTNGGAIVQPMVHVGWAGDWQHWRLGLGRLKGLRGDLDSPVIELSLAVPLSLPPR